jgi:hypothetical protein
MRFSAISKKDELLAKRRTFYDICSKDDLFIKVLEICRLWVRMELGIIGVSPRDHLILGSRATGRSDASASLAESHRPR